MGTASSEAPTALRRDCAAGWTEEEGETRGGSSPAVCKTELCPGVDYPNVEEGCHGHGLQWATHGAILLLVFVSFRFFLSTSGRLMAFFFFPFIIND